MHPACSLVVAANRDEWFCRPTAPAAFWHDAPQVFGGRDLERGGAALGLTRHGRFAALTNFRDPRMQRPAAPSRGALVLEFLTGTQEPTEYLRQLNDSAALFNGFNLLVSDGEVVAYLSNREGVVRVLEPGIYGLSNGLLDDPWPKVVKGKALLARTLGEPLDVGGLLELLHDREQAPDETLPSTGVGLEWERKLSAMHIVAGEYGTRSATGLIVGQDGVVQLGERTYDATGCPTGTVLETFSLERSR
jgi:uncharacterized protein with NRDE domain